MFQQDLDRCADHLQRLTCWPGPVCELRLLNEFSILQEQVFWIDKRYLPAVTSTTERKRRGFSHFSGALGLGSR